MKWHTAQSAYEASGTQTVFQRPRRNTTDPACHEHLKLNPYSSSRGPSFCGALHASVVGHNTLGHERGHPVPGEVTPGMRDGRWLRRDGAQLQVVYVAVKARGSKIVSIEAILPALTWYHEQKRTVALSVTKL